MTDDRALTSLEIREIGEVLYGSAWQGEMAKAVGVPRQSIGYYLKTGGVKGTQAAAIVGLLARMAVREFINARERQAAFDSRHAELSSLLIRFESRAL
jgi:hypothetical protein